MATIVKRPSINKNIKKFSLPGTIRRFSSMLPFILSDSAGDIATPETEWITDTGAYMKTDTGAKIIFNP